MELMAGYVQWWLRKQQSIVVHMQSLKKIELFHTFWMMNQPTYIKHANAKGSEGEWTGAPFRWSSTTNNKSFEGKTDDEMKQ